MRREEKSPGKFFRYSAQSVGGAAGAYTASDTHARNAAMIVYDGDLIKLSVNSMYVSGTANESHLRAGLVGTPCSLPSRLRNVYRVHEYRSN